MRWSEGPNEIDGLLCDPSEDCLLLGSGWRVVEMVENESTEQTDGEAADAATGDDLGETFAHRVQRAWKASVGTYATDEGETRNLLERLVEFGSLSQREAKDALGDMKSRIEENRRELDRRVDESLKNATARLTIPSPDDIDALRLRVNELEARVAAAEKRRG